MRLAASLALLAACADAPPGSTPDAPDRPSEDVAPGPAAPPTLRRLSSRELRNTIVAATGVEPGDALARLPPDARDDGFDRIASSQTLSAIHLDALQAVADAAAELMVTGRTLDALTPACPDVIVPPWTEAARAVLPATGFAGSPDWAMDVFDDHVAFLYSDTVHVQTTWAAPAAGQYTITIPVELDHRTAFPDITLRADGAAIGAWRGQHGLQELTATLQVDGPASIALELDLELGDYNWSGWTARIRDASVDGPLDPGAGRDDAARQTCAEALVVALARRAWRRPPNPDEQARLVAVVDAERGAASLRLGVEAALLSPNHLFLVELGEPERPGWYRLTDHEQAARLSYALCEGPPDAELAAAADAGALRTPAQIEAQARRLLDAPCGRATVARFHDQWLHLDELDGLARDPAYYPESTPALGVAMREETDRYLLRMIYDERAGLQAVWSSRRTWLDPDTAWLYGLSVPGPDTAVDLPPDRAGPLTHAAVLATTSKFSETSPVLRGVYVLEQLLCDAPDPPPQGLDITPPALDDAMTTRQRWEAHAANPGCASCHDAIDPIGFTLEGFDALGRRRETENGATLDTSGAIPALGPGELDGGRAAAEAIAGSDALRRCFARQWTRFASGRIDDDGDPIDAVADAARGDVHDALLALTRAERFRYRVVPEEAP